ncbi:helix-turn-helix domain-containing protein [Xylanimonas sp. McL0601]|uniref:helix-turn-helix domain-containing protein n=1 Tax=Xylanimonas sp. McL0601 TaxID=3414739 RepID=UPI003CF1674C
MANRPAPSLILRGGDRAELERWTRSTTVSAGLARRARIVLLAGAGVANTQIAPAVGVSVPTVLTWRDRYQRSGLARLGDAPRPGHPDASIMRRS